MSGEFDPYHQWLGIPAEEQPPDHYRLLGIPRFESDANVIENAADRQMTHLRTFQTGRHAETSQAILNEVARAKVCLLNSAKKAAYDESLRSAAKEKAVAEVPAAAPVAGAPFHIEAGEHTTLPARRSRQQPTPVWRQPCALAVGGGGLALVVVVLLMIASGTGDGPSPSGDGNPPVRSGSPPLRVSQADIHEAGTTDAPAVPDTPPTPPTPQPPAAETVNLLKRIDPRRDALGLPWATEDGALVSPVGPSARIQRVAVLPEQYVLTVTAERLSGDDSLVVGLVWQGRQFVANFDGWGGLTGGLQMIDDRYVPENDTVFRRRVLPPNKTVTLRCTLSKEGVRVEADGETLVDWHGRPARLSMSPEWQVANDSALFLGAAYSKFRITRWELAPLAP